jgi:hypothetical protein
MQRHLAAAGAPANVVEAFSIRNSGKGGDPMISGILKSAVALFDHAVVGAASSNI